MRRIKEKRTFLPVFLGHLPTDEKNEQNEVLIRELVEHEMYFDPNYESHGVADLFLRYKLGYGTERIETFRAGPRQRFGFDVLLEVAGSALNNSAKINERKRDLKDLQVNAEGISSDIWEREFSKSDMERTDLTLFPIFFGNVPSNSCTFFPL